MIFDVLKQSLKSSSVLIPIDRLIGNATGSRMPDVRPSLLTTGIAERVVAVCPTSSLAIKQKDGQLFFELDYGECIGCGRCFMQSDGALVPADKLDCCGASRQGLVRRWDLQSGKEIIVDEADLEKVSSEIRAVIGHALNIRQLDGGSCNGCEAEITALTSPYYDLERFGVHFVASPKHADMLLVTGPVTRNMAEAVKLTYESTPSPKFVIAVGACGVSGGIFARSYATLGGVDSLIPVDGYIPGCPPTPAMLLSGILHVLKARS